MSRFSPTVTPVPDLGSLVDHRKSCRGSVEEKDPPGQAIRSCVRACRWGSRTSMRLGYAFRGAGQCAGQRTHCNFPPTSRGSNATAGELRIR
ncbi:MAG: hypothetical protein JWL97_825 [Gemmatimonadales bacterium]|jgi:hypothetical protein|nr:hypothetical protein [Gemmatimonadales bacterium]